MVSIMLEPRCPKCGSSRVQYGYVPPLFLLKIFGIKSLLCNKCNHPFRAFALHSAVSRASKRRRKKALRDESKVMSAE